MAWTPSDVGDYAGTCIFLIALAVIFRGLLALRSHFQRTAWSRTPVQLLPAAYGNKSTCENDRDDHRELEKGTISGRSEVQPWRISVDGSRAVLDTVIVGIGYLLSVHHNVEPWLDLSC